MRSNIHRAELVLYDELYAKVYFAKFKLHGKYGSYLSEWCQYQIRLEIFNIRSPESNLIEIRSIVSDLK
jgi:hypothetical protein